MPWTSVYPLAFSVASNRSGQQLTSEKEFIGNNVLAPESMDVQSMGRHQERSSSEDSGQVHSSAQLAGTVLVTPSCPTQRGSHGDVLHCPASLIPSPKNLGPDEGV